MEQIDVGTKIAGEGGRLALNWGNCHSRPQSKTALGKIKTDTVNEART